MTGRPTDSNWATGDPDARVECPVCGAGGSEDGLRDHLRYDHGWDAERIRTELGPGEDGKRRRRSVTATADDESTG